MLIFTADRDIILQTQPLIAVPNIRTSCFSGKKYLVSINIYHGNELVGDFETTEEALSEMNAINRCKDEAYFVGGYHGRDAELVSSLNVKLRVFFGREE